jgi:hypothetical protein
MARQLIAIVLAMGAWGCAQTPSLDSPDRPFVKAIDVVNLIRCDLKQTATIPDLKGRLAGLVAKADLTLLVDETTGLAPSLGFISPYTQAGLSFTLGVGGNYSGTASRTHSHTVTIRFDDLGDDECPQRTDGFDLRSELGIREAIAEAVQVQTRAGRGSQLEAYSTKVNFVLTRSVNLGPAWVLKTFKGPTGNSSFLSAQRVDTHTLSIAFTPEKAGMKTLATPEGVRDVPEIDPAASYRLDRQLQNLNLLTILQQLTRPVP